MRSTDKLSSIFFILFSLAICLASLKLPKGSLSDPGPMAFPLLLGISLLILSVAFFVQSKSSLLYRFSDLFAKGEGLKAIYLLGTFSLCVLIFESVGFLVSIFVLLLLLFKGIGGKTIMKSIFYGSIISVLTFLLFTRLGIPLPKGILWF